MISLKTQMQIRGISNENIIILKLFLFSLSLKKVGTQFLIDKPIDRSLKMDWKTWLEF